MSASKPETQRTTDVPSPRRASSRYDGLSVTELKDRLLESEETLEAIRSGEVDAVVTKRTDGLQVYTLQNADRPYRLLVEQMLDGAITLNDDGLILYCNRRFAAIAGVSPEVIIGHPVHRFFSIGSRKRFLELLARDLEGGASEEFALHRPDGVEIPVQISMIGLKLDEEGPRVVCGIVTDLTKNAMRRQELMAVNAQLVSEIEERRRVEDGLQLALDAAGMGNWELDLRAGEARRSVRHAQIFGHAPFPNFELNALLMQFVPEDRPAVADAFARAESDGKIEFEKRIQRVGDQAIRWIQLKGRTYYDEGKAVRIAGVVVDVTERREVEEQLRHAQKMEAVGQLTGGIAHDFNNLLTVIGGSLEILGRTGKFSKESNRLLEAAHQAVARGANLNRQLLAFSRRQDLRTEVLCVDKLVPDIKHLLDRAIGETIKVMIVQEAQIWRCRADAQQLEAAIFNLAINARDAMTAGGILTLGLENRVVTGDAALSFGARPGHYVMIYVSDTGEGMSGEIASRAFDPFFTTKAIGQGTGLGLSQVYGFAKQSKGFVAIESEPGKGTIVSIYLPRTEELDKGSVSEAANRSEVQGRGTILVVEDDPDVRLTTKAMLQDLGYDVCEADTGAAALALVDSGQHFDLVFTDVVMPGGMNGIELGRQLKARGAHPPILLTSGYTREPVDLNRPSEDLPLLRKPFSQAKLSIAIREALKHPLAG